MVKTRYQRREIVRKRECDSKFGVYTSSINGPGRHAGRRDVIPNLVPRLPPPDCSTLTKAVFLIKLLLVLLVMMGVPVGILSVLLIWLTP